MSSMHIPMRLSRTAPSLSCQIRIRNSTFRCRRLAAPSSKSFSAHCPRLYLAESEAETEAAFKKIMAEEAVGNPRIVPASPSYFTAKPAYTDSLIALKTLLRKYQTLPVAEPGQAPRVVWRTIQQYRASVGEEVRVSRYAKIISILRRLNTIHPSLMPEEVATVLQEYKRRIDPFANTSRPTFIDEHGRAYGLGRRKSSTASVWVVEGEGEVLINGGPLNQHFGRIHDRESAIWALKMTQRVDKYNVWGIVRGGGTTGQAEALTLAIAKALLVHEPMLKPALRKAGCVTRDSRRVERKKPGKLKARKMPAWVKR